MKMKRKRRNRSDKMEAMAFINAITRFRRFVQYLKFHIKDLNNSMFIQYIILIKLFSIPFHLYQFSKRTL